MDKTLIFDFFDVIHRDPQKAWFALHGLRREGPYAEASDMMDQGKISLREYHERFANAKGMTYEDFIEEFESSAELIHDVHALLQELQGKHRIGLLSNTVHEEINPIMERHNLAPLFDEIVISANVGMSKPNPDIFRHMLQVMDVAPGDAIFIDDNPHNVDGAKSVGMNGIQYTDIASLRRQLAEYGVQVKETAAA